MGGDRLNVHPALLEAVRVRQTRAQRGAVMYPPMRGPQRNAGSARHCD
jgi:hypothetical protein